MNDVLGRAARRLLCWAILTALAPGCASTSDEIARGLARAGQTLGGYQGAVEPIVEPVRLAYGAAPPFQFRIEFLAEREKADFLASVMEGRADLSGQGGALSLRAELLRLEVNGRNFGGRSGGLGSINQKLDERGRVGAAEGRFEGLAEGARAGDEAVLEQVGVMAREDLAGLSPHRFPLEPVGQGDRLGGGDEVLGRFKLSSSIARLISNSDLGLFVEGKTAWNGRPALFLRYRGGADLFLPQDPPAASRVKVEGYSVIDLSSGLELEAEAILQVVGVSGAATGLNAVQRTRLDFE